LLVTRVKKLTLKYLKRIYVPDTGKKEVTLLLKRVVFRYEIKRIVFSKEYLLILTATLIYAISLLRGLVLYGVNYTAPFSGLTFATYCSCLTPFLFILLLLLCARFFRPSERGAEAIIRATCMPYHIFRLIRYSAAMCAFLFAALLPVSACLIFYRTVFDYKESGTLLFSGLLIIIPPAIFLFGVAIAIGRLEAAGVYILLAVIIVISIFQIRLPAFMDIIGTNAGQVLYNENQALRLSSSFITGRLIFSSIGLAFSILSIYRSRKCPDC